MSNSGHSDSRRAAEHTVTFLARYFRVLGIVQLIGLNLIGFVFLYFGTGIADRRSGVRKAAIAACAMYVAAFLAAMIWAGFQNFSSVRVRGPGSFESSAPWVIIPVAVIGMVVFAIPAVLLLRPSVCAQFLKTGCRSCGYDLRGADHGKCPECGEAVRKRRQPDSQTGRGLK